jgi:carboxypeptidase Q
MKMTIRLLLFIILIGSFGFLYAQHEIVDTAVFQKIRNAELNSSQIPQIAHYLTDVSGSRLTNSPGFKRAGTWAIESMKKWGLQNTAFEPWGEYGRGWDVEEFNILMRAPYAGYIIGYPLPWSSNTDGEIRAPIFEMSDSQLLDSAWMEKHRDEIKGKIIFLTNPGARHEGDFKPFSKRYTDSELVHIPNTYVYTHKQIAFIFPLRKRSLAGKIRLKEFGALAVIGSKGDHRDGTVFVQNSNGYKTDSPVLLPEAVISAEDGFKINRLLASAQQVEISLNIKGKFYSSDTKAYNIIGEIPGTDPVLKDQIVMLGAHLDSWNAATGATDNAAGSAVMLEVVRLIDSLHLKPKRTIRIALWSGEEQGVYGSYNYVKNHFGNGETGVLKPEQAKVSVYFNLDGGSGKIRGIFADGDTAAKPIFEQWLVPFYDLGAQTVTLNSSGSTDHVSFEWAGIPGFQFIQDPLDYEPKTHHTNMDTYDYLQLDDMKQAAIIVASFVYQASIRPDLLPRNKMVNEIFPFEGL